MKNVWEGAGESGVGGVKYCILKKERFLQKKDEQCNSTHDYEPSGLLPGKKVLTRGERMEGATDVIHSGLSGGEAQPITKWTRGLSSHSM